MRLQTASRISNGYTLIEIIVTLIILAIGILGILSAFSFSSKGSTVSDKKLMAANKGRELLESLRSEIDSRTWDNWALNCDGVEHAWPSMNFDGNPIMYNCTSHSSGARQVTVRLNWVD